MEKQVVVVDHPLVRHKLGYLRRKETNSAEFRRLVHEVSIMIGYEATRDLPLASEVIETPLARADASILSGRRPCLVSILRAGNGILEGMLAIMPWAQVGHIGIYRDPESLRAVEYFYKAPDNLDKRRTFVVDPIIATGNTVVAAVNRLKGDGAKDLRFVNIVAAPEGIEAFHGAHPDVPIYTAAVDERLDEHGYIVPGVGDMGDRFYGTG